MNILFLTSTLPRYPDDGQAPFVLEQALAWKDYFPDDGVFILAPHDVMSKRREMAENVSIRRFRYWWPAAQQKLAYPAILPNVKRNPLLLVQLPIFLLSEFITVRSLIKTEGIDFIFAHWVMPQGITAFLINKVTGTPYGLKNYSSDLRVFQKIPLIGRCLARNIIKSSQRVICENSMLREEALDYFAVDERSHYEDRVTALTMGVFYGLDEQPRAKDAEYDFDFGFIGRLSKKKGVDALIKAFTELKSTGISFSAAIAGTGEEKEALERSCDLPELRFLGHISGKQKQDFFSRTKFFVFPSCESKGDIEGLPVALLEALYMGKIIIASKATNVQLLPEWEEIRDRIFLIDDPYATGELVRVCKDLLQLNASEIRRRVDRTQSFVQAFKWENRIGEYRRLLIGDAL